MAFKKPKPTRADYEKYQKHTESLLRDDALDYVDTIRAAALRKVDQARDEALDAVKKDPSRKGEFFGPDGRLGKAKSRYFGTDSDDALNLIRARNQEFSEEAVAKRKAEMDRLRQVDEERMARGMKKGGKVKAKASKPRGSGCCKRTKKCKMY